MKKTLFLLPLLAAGLAGPVTAQEPAEETTPAEPVTAQEPAEEATPAEPVAAPIETPAEKPADESAETPAEEPAPPPAPEPAEETAAEESGSVYGRVYAVLSSFPHRRVGSENLKASFAAIEKELRDAGLRPRYQTFDSLAQVTDRMEASYGGAPLEGVLAIDGGPSAFAPAEPFEGPAVFAGAGLLEDLDGKDLKGAIAILDAERPDVTVEHVFTHGALAAVLVGGPDMDAWNLRHAAFTSISLVPRVYLDRARAEAAGLLEADGSKTLRIDGHAELRDAAGCNLWVELPGPAPDKDSLKEALILSATVDTYGLTPEYSPELRGAANAALLAETAVRMAAAGPTDRRVIVVFFGSRYGSQEGARFFYHALDMADPSRYSIGLDERAEGYRKELAETKALANALVSANAISARGEEADQLRIRLKTAFAGLSNRIRSRMEELRTRKEAGTATEEEDAEFARLDERRAACNALREQVNARRYDDAGKPAVRALYEEQAGELLASLRQREAELERFLAHNATWRELSAEFADRTVIAHFDFDFSAADRPWLLTMINAKRMFRSQDITPSVYARHLKAIHDVYYGTTNAAENARAGISAGHLDPDAEDPWQPLYRPTLLKPTFKPYSLAAPGQRVVPSVLSTSLGFAGFQCATLGDRLAHENLPLADPADLEPLASQTAALFGALARGTAFSLNRVCDPVKLESRFTYHAESGVNFLDYAPGSTESEGLPKRAVAYVLSPNDDTPSTVGQSAAPRARILANGRIYLPFIDDHAGIRTLAVGFGEDGAPDRVAVLQDTQGIQPTPVHLFHLYGGLSFGDGYAPDPLGSELYHPETLIASKDAPHKTFLPIKFDPHGYKEFFADRPDDIKIIGTGGDMLLGSYVPTNGGDRVEAAMGAGVPLAAGRRLRADNVAQGASDACILNETRLSVLRDRNIVRDDLERLHADAKDHLEAAGEAAADRKWSLARAHDVFATCIENRVYRPLRGVTEDLVQAVVLLLLLNIPFAFAMERLIFGFPSIYKQIVGFVGFFLLTFGILYATHPAFSLASAPIIIFLAFVIIMLGVIVSTVMMGKIKQEIRAMQGLSSTVHGVESDSSTTMSAILIGIAGMRNRPLKTFLTCATVVLLTFTILVFASFSSKQGVVATDLGRGAGENRIELHRASWLDVDRDLLDAIRALYGGEFALARRGGLFRSPTRPGDTGTPTNPDRILLLPKSGETLPLDAVMGADPVEFERSAGFRSVCGDFGKGEFEHPPIYLPPFATNRLTKLEPGDEVRLNGFPFTYAGPFDTVALQNLATIDNQRVLPPNFQSTLSNSGSTGGSTAERLENVAPGSFEWFSPDMVGLARMDDLQAGFGDLCMVNFLALYPTDPDVKIDDAAESLAPVFQGTVHVKSAKGARRLLFTDAVQGSGLSDVLVPLLLGGLIIFSSLMGSIVVREREIFTYSALGLAPVDVGALFFAESAVYSVVGGMGGYLFSQLVAKFVKWMASRGWITPLEMNFSSLTSVCTILIVMAVVMLSTVFPALRASKSANPGVARKWKMPRPKGDKLEFVFPFTVSTVDFAGILSFIREHFGNHSDATLGSFAARDVKLFRRPDPKKPGRDTIGIEANVSLAPFDLGIFQKFRMYSQEFEIKGIDEVVVDLVRIGGTPDSWARSNRAFASELREQFLLWRSLPIETVEHYRAETKKELGLES